MSTHTTIHIGTRPVVTIGATATAVDLELAWLAAADTHVALHIDLCGGSLEQFCSALSYLSALSLAHGRDPLWRIHRTPLAGELLAPLLPRMIDVRGARATTPQTPSGG